MTPLRISSEQASQFSGFPAADIEGAFGSRCCERGAFDMILDE